MSFDLSNQAICSTFPMARAVILPCVVPPWLLPYHHGYRVGYPEKTWETGGKSHEVLAKIQLVLLLVSCVWCQLEGERHGGQQWSSECYPKSVFVGAPFRQTVSHAPMANFLSKLMIAYSLKPTAPAASSCWDHPFVGTISSAPCSSPQKVWSIFDIFAQNGDTLEMVFFWKSIPWESPNARSHHFKKGHWHKEKPPSFSQVLYFHK